MIYEFQIAEICHEANAAYCRALGDYSQKQWIYAPDWQRDSAIKGVLHKLVNPTATPEQMHENWTDQKNLEGWVWGPEKDVVAKQHPCMVPYAELPEAQHIKDELFSAIVSVFAKYST